jgi:hypothetical protein
MAESIRQAAAAAAVVSVSSKRLTRIDTVQVLG